MDETKKVRYLLDECLNKCKGLYKNTFVHQIIRNSDLNQEFVINVKMFKDFENVRIFLGYRYSLVDQECYYSATLVLGFESKREKFDFPADKPEIGMDLMKKWLSENLLCQEDF